MEVELPAGTVLNNKWRINALLGRGACGIVYSVSAHTPALQAITGSTRYVAKCISHGAATLSKAKKREAEKMAHTLNLEMNLLAPGKLLADFKYRPRVPFEHYYGRDEALAVTYLIIEQLDYDLMQWAKMHSDTVTKGGKRSGTGSAVSSSSSSGAAAAPPLSEIAGVGLQILDGVEWLHRKGWLYVDFKPDNFMFRGNELVFIDCKLPASSIQLYNL
jgi:serine/threonine protein kinase